MKQVYKRQETYVVSWVKDGVTYETRFDNIPDAVKFAGCITDLANTITRIDIEMGDLVEIGA